MEAARRKMQEELDAKAAIFKEKQKQVWHQPEPRPFPLKLGAERFV